MTDSASPFLYILSAGRTGTVFLEKLLSVYAPHILAKHEPSPTREQMMLANLRNDYGVGGGLLKWWFKKSRTKRVAAESRTYIEINPFLCAMTDLLCETDHPVRIVHVTREPKSWARSMTVFGASSKFRWFIDYVPFAKPYPNPRPSGWSRWTYYERNLARWVWCNSRICALEDQAEAYTHVRYEDLFCEVEETRNDAVMRVLDTLGLERPIDIDWKLFDARENPAPSSNTRFAKTGVEQILHPLSRELGYET